MSRVRAKTGFAAATAAVLCALVLASAAGAAPSLYSGPGHRPGPDLLYSKSKTPPQLQNRGVWKAPPILVSGASAYRTGEFLYQDFLYDDHGANGQVRDPADPRVALQPFAQANGTYMYPDDTAYAENAADIVEFRVRPLRAATAFRVTLNTLKDPKLAAFTIAIGGSAAPVAFPHGANATAPARLFLTWHGGEAELRRAAGGALVTPAPRVSVSVRRRQVQLLVPHAVWNPGRATVRFAMGAGVWDEANDRYLLPQQARTATVPGGAGNLAQPPAFFNVAFRQDEPFPEIANVLQTAQNPAWWRDQQQGVALRAGDLSPFHANVSFAKLRDRVRDDTGVPRRGPINRILASRFEPGQGVDYGVRCFPAVEGCTGAYLGRLQSYALYVPRKPKPDRGYGFTFLLHSLSAPYNQYSASRHQSQFGERGPGSVIATPQARGPDGFYDAHALADTFEVYADVARRYDLDPSFTSIAGYSMGAIGSFKIAQMFPDLFARVQPTVGSEDTTSRMASLRNLPVLMWNGAGDELQPPSAFQPTAQALDELGYRYELDVFEPGEHLSLAINDEYRPAARFLGGHRVGRNPFHVTYVVDPETNEKPFRIVADHAYWLSRLKLRGAGQGQIDAVSDAFGMADPVASATQAGAGALPGGYLLDPYPFTRQYKTWDPAPSAPKANRIVIEAENIASAVLDVGRARLGCKAVVEVETDGPIAIRLAGCKRVVRAG